MPATITADTAAGDTFTELATDYMAQFPTVPLRTPSANFSFGWNGVLTDYVLGQPAVVSADQFAAMTAAGCPIA